MKRTDDLTQQLDELREGADKQLRDPEFAKRCQSELYSELMDHLSEPMANFFYDEQEKKRILVNIRLPKRIQNLMSKQKRLPETIVVPQPAKAAKTVEHESEEVKEGD